ncbi:MAG: acetyl-CoA carboxylase biotin carboxyl carrier protein subunit [Telmatospirillum sp.]|nr:acetyl-CoA carboxylase biotin carboxyl carrier protein subunit [Telmatospirillum sp.]
MKLQIGIDGKKYELDVEVIEEDHAPRPRAPISPYSATPTTMPSVPAAPPPAAAAADEVVDEDKACRSPVSGVVIRINAKVGQKLQPNDLIMVLEAMKMETSVTSPVAGTVKSIKVAQGDGVKVHQVLVEFE